MKCGLIGSPDSLTSRRADMKQRVPVAIGLFAMLCLGAAPAAEVKPLEIGSAAPDFSLPGVDGKTYNLKDFADAKVLVIIFSCNHCPTAQAYETRIKQLYADYKDKGAAVVAI